MDSSSTSEPATQKSAHPLGRPHIRIRKFFKRHFIRLICGALLVTPTNAQANFFEGLLDTFTDAFDTPGLIILGVGGALTAASFRYDQDTHDAWVDHQRMSKDVSSIGEFWGTGIPEVGIALGQLIFDSERGIAHTESLIVGQVATHSLKFAVGKQRPNSESKNSFPSGHTSVSFTTATNLTYAYGWWIGGPLYAMGAFTGATRLADNAHWLSDVVAGATVGVLFGRSSFKHHTSITPMVINDGGRGMGLMVTHRF